MGPGGEAEGVVERELGERHEGGERRAERRLGGLARWRHGLGESVLGFGLAGGG